VLNRAFWRFVMVVKSFIELPMKRIEEFCRNNGVDE
jgi:hypothetical protein